MHSLLKQGGCPRSLGSAAQRPSTPLASQRGASTGAQQLRASAARTPMFSPDGPSTSSALQQQLDQLSDAVQSSLASTASASSSSSLAPPSEADLQAGAAAAAQLAKRVAGAVGDGVGAAVAPFALFDSGWTTNVLFWVVLSLLLYNLVLLAPRQ